MHYQVYFMNDMGHLLCYGDGVPRHIEKLAFEKAKNKYDVYTDGARTWM